MSDMTVWRSRLLPAVGAQGFFFGRTGGASAGCLASLNLSADLETDPLALLENEARVLRLLGVGGLYLPRQVHGVKVDLIIRPVAGVVRGREADAAITALDNLALGVLTADCVPVLLAAASCPAIAAVHAGWRGLRGGVIRDAVERLTRVFGVHPADLVAAVGPAIGPEDYEVSREMGEMFLEKRSDGKGVIWPDRRRNPRLDLRILALQDLLAAELDGDNIEFVGPATADPRCFSHRRDEGRTGRQLAAVFRPAAT